MRRRAGARERLIDELFAEQSVNSADDALRNHVSRLRKATKAEWHDFLPQRDYRRVCA